MIIACASRLTAMSLIPSFWERGENGDRLSYVHIAGTFLHIFHGDWCNITDACVFLEYTNVRVVGQDAQKWMVQNCIVKSIAVLLHHNWTW